MEQPGTHCKDKNCLYTLSWERILIYSLIAFNERVTFGFNAPGHCLVRMLHYLRLRLVYNHYAIAHAYNAANTHAQGSNRGRCQKVTLSSKAIRL